jgi:Protein of unknown function (DUF3667).
MSGPFCSHCGEKKLEKADYSLRPVVQEVFGEFIHFDGRLLRTVKTLVAKPGELARAYFHGGRSRYTRPLTLFVMINLVFFIIQPHTALLGYHYDNYVSANRAGSVTHRAMIRDKLLRTHESEVSYSARFNTVLQDQKKSVLLFSVPFLALAMLILFAGKGRTYAEHLVFSVHVYTFLLLLFIGLLAVFWILVLVATLAPHNGGAAFFRLLDSELTITVVGVAAISTYIYLAARRAYELRGALLAVRAFLLALAIGYLTGVYHDILFYTTFWST